MRARLLPWLFAACLPVFSSCSGGDAPLQQDKTKAHPTDDKSTRDGAEDDDSDESSSASSSAETSTIASGDDGAATDTDSGTEPPLERDYTKSPRVGESAITQVYDRETHLTPDTQVTLRAEGDRIVVYVEDDLYGELIDDAQLNGFIRRVEVAGNPDSSEPSSGVLALDEATFAPLDITQYPGGKLPVFVVDTNGAGAGYLCSWCTERSLHLDAKDLAPLDDDPAVSIFAHEFIHAIHRGYDPGEASWVDETLAEAAMVVNGFFTDVDVFTQYVRSPNVKWGPTVTDFGGINYGGCMAFGTYLWEQGGAPLLHALTVESGHDWSGVDAGLSSVGDPRTGLDLFLEMGLALYFDDPARGYGFTSLLVPGQLPSEALRASAATEASLQPYGLVYFSAAEGLSSIRIDGDESIVGLIATDTDRIEVTSIVSGVDMPFTGPAVVILTAETQANVTVTVQ